MTQNNLTTQPIQPVSLMKPLLIGGGIALMVIAFFVFGVDQPNPEWGKLWGIKPLIVTPLAGAMGGAIYYFLDQLSYRGGLNKTIAVLLSLVGYLIALWLGIVLGLNGTLWN
jgi:hypothetical protein